MIVRSACSRAAQGQHPRRLLRNIIDAFAAYERALIRSRTKAALAVKKAKGERTGGVPYGWRLDAAGSALVEDPAGQAALARARALRAAGCSLREIGNILAAEGHVPRSGGRWAVQTIRRLTASAVKP